MRHRIYRFWWLPLLVIVGLLAQSLPAYSPRVQAAPSTASITAVRPLDAQIRQLIDVLTSLEGAAEDGDRRTNLPQIAEGWSRVLQVDRQSRAAMVIDQPNTLLREYNRQLATLDERYQAIMAAQGDATAFDQAVSTFRAALERSVAGSVPPSPSFEQLPNRPEEAEPIQTLPALRLDPGPASDVAGAVPSQSAPPGPADLASTEDAAITPEIQALADQLGRNAGAIYQYVYNNIAFEPYYGSHKGALLTLWERSGNDVDIASLLIALLRASGIPARYAEGRIAINGDSARNWVGNAPNLGTAGQILSTGGVPDVAITGDNMLVKRHVWVLASTSATGGSRIYLPLVAKGTVGNTADTAPAPSVAIGPEVTPAQAWVPLDASFKQFTYTAPANLAAVTGFNAGQYVDEFRASTAISDTARGIFELPQIPAPDDPENDSADREFAEVKAQEAVSRTIAYIEARPQLTNQELLGGAYIITRNTTTLPGSLPWKMVPGSTSTEFSAVPATLRDYITVELFNASGTTRQLTYRASFPALANKRITVSYEAATPSDQALIDSKGGAILTTPPAVNGDRVNLIPVLRINGAEVARGSTSPQLGTFQTRSLTFETARGRSNTVQNSITVGETFAVGIGYGRTSAQAIQASQERLAAARAALPKNGQGDPDLNAPGNMAEPVVGEMLHLAMQAYFNQLDSFSEVTARSRNLRWFRSTTAGIAIQNLVIGYSFGIPVQNRGGGMTFDIQQNLVGAISLQGQERDEQVFLRTTGYVGSALENSVFENAGQGSVSTIRLLELALERNVPVYRIDKTNKAEVFPRLRLSASTENYISDEIDEGNVVTVSEDEIEVHDWQGVGFTVTDPATGAAAYLISGGLNGSTGIYNGGSFWDVLKTVAAYAWLAINFGLDLWGVWAGIGLLLVPEPTLLTKAAGIALIAANLAALGFDIADLMDLVSGDKSASEYIGEQITGLLIEAILKRVGISAAAEIIRRIGPDATNKVVRQLDELTEGATRRLRCSLLAQEEETTPVAPQQSCPGLSADEIAQYSSRVTTKEGWDALADMSTALGNNGGNAVRQLMRNDYVLDGGVSRIERVARAIADAPRLRNGAPIPGYDAVLDKALSQNLGHPYEFQRAIALDVPPGSVVEYGRRVPVEFRTVTGIDPVTRRPILGGTTTQPLEGDIVLVQNGRTIFVDAKHGPQSDINELRIWKQIRKAAEALRTNTIDEYRFNSSAGMLSDWQTYVQELAQLPEYAGTDLVNRLKFVTNLGDDLY